MKSKAEEPPSGACLLGAWSPTEGRWARNQRGQTYRNNPFQ